MSASTIVPLPTVLSTCAWPPSSAARSWMPSRPSPDVAFGSPAAAGLGDAVLRMEAERPVPVVGRLLEHRIDGPFAFETPDGPRAIGIRAKADRIDLLADGSILAEVG